MVLLKMRGVRLLTVLLIAVINSISISADANYVKDESITVSSAYYLPDHKGYNLDGTFAPITYSPVLAENDNERNLGSTWGAVELMGNYKINLKKDFLTGGSALTKDNSLKHTFTFGLSPVDVSFAINNSISPIAFLEFALGTSLATGWKAIGVDGLSVYTDPNGADTEPLQGVYSKTWLSGTFQFDLAAVMSGDTTWKHIVILSNHNINFNYFSAAGENDPWIYQGGDATFNGFQYDHSSFIGYKMPLVLEMTGLLIETGVNLFDYAKKSKVDESGWGSDYLELKLGALFSFKLSEHQSIVILPQFKRNIRFTDVTVKDKYFANRVVDTDNPTFWDFDRIAFSYSYKF